MVGAASAGNLSHKRKKIIMAIAVAPSPVIVLSNGLRVGLSETNFGATKIHVAAIIRMFMPQNAGANCPNSLEAMTGNSSVSCSVTTTSVSLSVK